MTPWIVVAVAGTTIAVLVWWALRRFGMLAYLATALVALWTLMPWRIDDDNFAPAFVVLMFRWVLEPDGDPAGVAAALVTATLLILAVFLSIYAARSIAAVKGRRKDESVAGKA